MSEGEHGQEHLQVRVDHKRGAAAVEDFFNALPTPKSARRGAGGTRVALAELATRRELFRRHLASDEHFERFIGRQADPDGVREWIRRRVRLNAGAIKLLEARQVGEERPHAGLSYNELHHLSWNACSSALCHTGHGGHGRHSAPLERRYLIVPGLRSSPHLRAGHQAGPAQPLGGPHHRGGGAGQQGRLPAAAHPALRARRHLHIRPWRANGNDGPGGVTLP
jgi:56kDa selenium binding protein (SBP56)